jgi:hypothetical protein
MDVTKAITDIECFRQSHVAWAEYFEKNPELEREYVSRGIWDDAAEHRRIVDCYDNVLAILRSLGKDA